LSTVLPPASSAQAVEGRVLVVEDDEATAELERRALLRAGYEVTIAGSVNSALNLLAAGRFDAILLDYNLPDGEPWTLVEAARARSPRIPVVLVTAAGSEPIVAEALQRGVGDYIRKSPSYLARIADVVRRVTSLARAEEGLRHSGTLFQMIAEHGDDMIMTLDGHGVIRYVSAACRRLLGVEMTDLVGSRVEDLVHADDDAAAVFRLDDQTSPVALRREIYRLRHRDGHYVWVESNLQRSQDAELIAITRDVSARIATQQKIEAALHEKTVLLNEVHHRVKNNLQIIISLLNLQRDHADQPLVHAALMESESRIRAMSLIHQFLYEQKNFARLDLAAYLKQLGRLVEGLHSGVARNIELLVTGPAAPVWLPFDQAVPCGLLINELLTNAYRHAFPAGRSGQIQLKVFSDDDRELQLTVADNGIGLPNGLSLDKPPSLGLQLAGILVEQLGGRWRYERNVQGTRFEMRIPTHEPTPIPIL